MITLAELESLKERARQESQSYGADEPLSVAWMRLHDAVDIVHALKIREMIPPELLEALFVPAAVTPEPEKEQLPFKVRLRPRNG